MWDASCYDTQCGSGWILLGEAANGMRFYIIIVIHQLISIYKRKPE